jgi:CheY-like chemotaxis protein/signal transduction histidine kinase
LLRALNQVALAADQATTPEETLAAAGAELERWGFTYVVFLTDDSQTQVFPRHGNFEHFPGESTQGATSAAGDGLPIPIDASDIHRQVVWRRKAFFLRNWAEALHSALAEGSGARTRPGLGIGSARHGIVTPLVTDDRVVGELWVQSEDLAEGDVPAVTMLARQMAAAWRSAGLMRELQSSLRKLALTQARLREAQKMEPIAILAGGVGHDLNNLLTAIAGYSELLLSELPPEDSRRMDVTEVLRACRRAAALTRQLLAVGRRQMPQPRMLDLNALLTDAESRLQCLVGEGVDLVTSLDPQLPQVSIDPALVEQAIMNLVVNAQEALPLGGRVTIQTCDVTLDAEHCLLTPSSRPGRFACLSVARTQISTEQQGSPGVSKPPVTGEADSTSPGLSIVHAIVQQHQGWTETERDTQGRPTFSIFLPAVSAVAESAASEVAPPKVRQGSGQGILLVEDEAGVRRFAARVLGGGGYLVYEASTVQEALNVFEQNSDAIHLVFTDVVLPDGTGLQLAGELIARRPRIRALLSSGYADGESQWSIVRQRGFRFLPKPYTLPDLLGAVGEVMGDSVIGCPEAELRQQSRSVHATRTSALAAELQGRPILVVDDNAADRLILREMLAQSGLEVMEAQDGPTCLLRFRRAGETCHPFGLVLLDKMMPGMDGFAVAEQIRDAAAFRDTPLIMVSSDSLQREAARCHELGIAAYIPKPVDQSELLHAMRTALGKAPSATTSLQGALPAAVETVGLRILLAEDNAAVRQTGRRTLEKAGHTVQVASSGVEALHMVEKGRFDLILMDVAMPQMDGLEATLAIREREAASGRHIPIIAMTGYAAEEDQARCLKAGMDGYVCKPFTPEILYRAIESCVLLDHDLNTEVPVDLDAALQVVGGDEELLGEAVGLFLEQDYPRQLQALREGLETHDAQAVRAAAHGIKGTLRSFGGLAASDVAARLEAMGREGNLSSACSVLKALEAGVDQFAAFYSQPRWT